jgi:hypothetical protein
MYADLARSGDDDYFRGLQHGGGRAPGGRVLKHPVDEIAARLKSKRPRTPTVRAAAETCVYQLIRRKAQKRPP